MIETDRLILREWRDSDAEAMYEIGQDPRVMAFLGPLMNRNEARDLVAGQILNQSLFGHCFWPIERRSDGMLIGFCGLNPAPRATGLDDEIEIGWRLAHHAWGRGYAREAAVASIDWAWAALDVPRIVAMTVAANTASWRLMQRLGMTRRFDLDFEHPAIAVDDPLRPHIVYEIARPAR